MARQLSDAALGVLQRSTLEETYIKLPDERLDPKLYKEVNTALESLGAKWNRKQQAHVFPSDDRDRVAEKYQSVTGTGTWVSSRDTGFFPTPDWLVDRMVDEAMLEPRHLILEPSAGRGAILRGILRRINLDNVDAIELDPENCKTILDLRLHTRSLIDGDFLSYHPDESAYPGTRYDRILMNPPFAKNAAMYHVQHALTMLAPGGRLIAIMPGSIQFREDLAWRELREKIQSSGTLEKLPRGTFKEVGTDVHTTLAIYHDPREEIASGMTPRRRPTRRVR